MLCLAAYELPEPLPITGTVPFVCGLLPFAVASTSTMVAEGEEIVEICEFKCKIRLVGDEQKRDCRQ
jgi:hypothetical protein